MKLQSQVGVLVIYHPCEEMPVTMKGDFFYRRVREGTLRKSVSWVNASYYEDDVLTTLLAVLPSEGRITW